MDALWIPTSVLNFSKPTEAPPGSLVFVASYSSSRPSLSPALRFDLVNDDGSVAEWLLWLRGGPWGPDKAQRTATKCKDFHANDEVVPTLIATDSLKIGIEIDFTSRLADDVSWHRANGLLAGGEFGVRIVAIDHFQHSSNAIPVCTSSWRYDPKVLRCRVNSWYPHWRVRVTSGDDKTLAAIPFELPSIE